MVEWARETLQEGPLALEVTVLDRSLLTSSYHLNIHPCKGCVSTAIPLCHWPCSRYPNHSLGQTRDWMGLIDAGTQARLDRFIGHYHPYATSHEPTGADKALQVEVRNVADAVANADKELRAGRLSQPGKNLLRPLPK